MCMLSSSSGAPPMPPPVPPPPTLPPAPGRNAKRWRPLARPKRAHFSFSSPFFAVVIEDDRIDDVLKNMTDKAPPGV